MEFAKLDWILMIEEEHNTSGESAFFPAKFQYNVFPMYFLHMVKIIN